MTTLLIKNAHTLVTMNAMRQEIKNGAMLIDKNVITWVGESTNAPETADEIVDLRGRHVVLPGFVNTHHHFYQTLTRTVPAAQNCDLFVWLKTLYPIWARLTAEGVYASTLMASAELILSGCTTASDHLYIYPNDCTLDDEIRAAQAIGIRFHPCRGSMSVGESLGGLPPDSVVEEETDILKDSQRLIEQYHDPQRHAMLRIVLAPCSPFSVSQDLMRESAALARSYTGVRLHTHLAENQSDIDYSREVFGMLPEEYAESVGWLGADVWHAHCVMLGERAIAQFAATQTGVTHCPNSNTRTAAGIAPIRQMLDHGVPVSLGADGAAANDATNLLSEARNALLLSRVRERNAAAMTARDILEIATLGGAKVLGRDDIGTLAPGMSADFITFDLDRPQFVGIHDAVAAVILCQANSVDYSFINGKKVVEKGELVTVELGKLVEKVNAIAHTLMNK